MSNTVINTSTKSLLKVFESRGHGADDILSSASVEAKSLFVPQGRLEVAQMCEIWRQVYERTDDTIGLQAAAVLPIGAYGVLDYLMLSSSTLNDVFPILKRFYPLVNSGAALSIQNHRNLVSIELCNPSETLPDHLKRSAEYTFAVLLQRFRLATGKQSLKPFRIDFTHALPSYISYYQKIFQTNLQFNQTANRIVFEYDLLKLSLPQGDAHLAEMLKHHADRLLSNIPIKEDPVENVRQVLRSHLRRGGNVSLNATARALAMSERALQRKLNASGTTYQAILDGLRCELAFDYLSHKLNVREIAQLLGFSEASAFSRAFKNWTGKTLLEIKRNGNAATHQK